MVRSNFAKNNTARKTAQNYNGFRYIRTLPSKTQHMHWWNISYIRPTWFSVYYSNLDLVLKIFKRWPCVLIHAVASVCFEAEFPWRKVLKILLDTSSLQKGAVYVSEPHLPELAFPFSLRLRTTQCFFGTSQCDIMLFCASVSWNWRPGRLEMLSDKPSTSMTNHQHTQLYSVTPSGMWRSRARVSPSVRPTKHSLTAGNLNYSSRRSKFNTRKEATMFPSITQLPHFQIYFKAVNFV